MKLTFSYSIYIIALIFVIVKLVDFTVTENFISKKNNHLITYYIYESTIDPRFANAVFTILSTSKWNRYRMYTRTYDKYNADIYIHLKSNKWLERYHKKKKYYLSGKQIRWSITTQSKWQKPNVYINAQLWINGVPESGLSLNRYREYVINHEFGHALGYDHQKCNDANEICPVMYQSTRGCPQNKRCGYEPDARDIQRRIYNSYL